MDARAPCFEVLGFQLGRARGATRAKRAALGLKVARFPLATARHGPANLPPCVVARARVVPSIAEGIFSRLLSPRSLDSILVSFLREEETEER